MSPTAFPSPIASSPEQFGPYLVYERLGVGGMASVHRAEALGSGGFRKSVALKRLLPHVASNPELVRSFLHEARLASHLCHANIAHTYDLGRVDETYFIAMEFVSGPTLGDCGRQCRDAGVAIPIRLVCNLLIQICDALDHAHNACDATGAPLGIIHRDVSPSNIIVSATGDAKLIDFGIAKATNSVHT